MSVDDPIFHSAKADIWALLVRARVERPSGKGVLSLTRSNGVGVRVGVGVSVTVGVEVGVRVGV